MMKVFIPIKHNSQRVPGKNYKEFHGEPLYKHTLLKYRKHEVFVDTDSDEIIEGISSDPRLQNVNVYRRNPGLIGDEVSVCELIKDYILRYDVKDAVAQIHVTSPFLRSHTLEEASKLIGQFDSVVACTKHNSRFWREESYGPCPVNHNPLRLEQTQDLPTLYEENSAFYIFKPEVLNTTNNRIGLKPYFYPVNPLESVDIDTGEDWHLAKMAEGLFL